MAAVILAANIASFMVDDAGLPRHSPLRVVTPSREGVTTGDRIAF